MTYQYRVSLKGIRGFFRVYHLNSENTLYSFHKQMRADMEFTQDQLILFKALNDKGEVVARYGLFDLGDGTVDGTTLAQTVKRGVKSFVYFYDVTNKKSVEITFEGVVEDKNMNVSTPTLVDTKGPNPIEFENGYIAFEDLPDDQRHLPGEADKARSKSKMDDLLKALSEEVSEDDDEELEDSEAEDMSEEDGDDEEEDNDREEEILVYDGSEELTL